MKSAAYWAERAAASEEILNREAERTIRLVQSAYDKAIQDIRKDMLQIFGKIRRDGTLTADEARVLLNTAETDKTLALLRKKITGIKDQRLKKELLMQINMPSYRERLSRLQAMQTSIETEFKKLAEIQAGAMHTRFIDTMTESYLRSIHAMQTGTGLGFSFNMIPTRAIEAALKHKWDGKNYSSRVWENTAYTAEKAKEIITSGLATGKTIRRMARELDDATRGGKLAAERLIRSENNYFINQGTLEGYKESGLSKYWYLAALDARTCSVCGKLDKKVFDISAAVVGENYPPIHWNDRCTVSPYIEGKDYSELKRRARDPVTGKNYLVPADMDYEEWRKSLTEEQAGELRYARQGQSAGTSERENSGTKPELIGTVDFANKNAVLSALEKHENGIVKQDHETAIVISPAGDVWRVEGSEGYVPTDLLGDALSGAYATHNHPDKETHYSFSGDDAGFFLQNRLAVSRGVDHRYVYIMERGEKTPIVGYDDAAQQFNEIYNHEILGLFFEDKIDIDIDGYHLTMLRMAEKYGFDYRREKR